MLLLLREKQPDGSYLFATRTGTTREIPSALVFHSVTEARDFSKTGNLEMVKGSYVGCEVANAIIDFKAFLSDTLKKTYVYEGITIHGSVVNCQFGREINGETRDW